MYKLFSALLVTVLVSGCAASTTEQSTSDLVIYPSAKETRPLQVGALVPTFSVLNVDGSTQSYPAGKRDNPLMIVTFRGGWCPFCNVHLQELRKVVPELNKKGMEIAFFSGDRPDILYASLQGEAKTIATEKGYQIYSDANIEAASALGIAFMTPEKMRARMIEMVDASEGSIDQHSALPVPAVFIIDSAGKVAFVYTNPDYKVRLSADETREAALKVLNM